ncbi:MAG: class I SAM-dependent methyltransferase [Candidatus Bathycorpusculaceae bacterium]
MGLKLKSAEFEREYFRYLKYSSRKRLIERHFLDVLKWASDVLNLNLLAGKGKTALDVGCAYGYAVRVLGSLGYRAYGVDVSKYGLRQAKKGQATDFVVCDVQEGLPFKENFFDLITCIGVLEHLTHSLQALNNMLYACKGTIVCTTPNKIVEKPVKRVLRNFDETHINVRAPWNWERLIKENLECSFVKVDLFFDAGLRVADKLLLFKSFKIPYFGLDARILIKK